MQNRALLLGLLYTAPRHLEVGAPLGEDDVPLFALDPHHHDINPIPDCNVRGGIGSGELVGGDQPFRLGPHVHEHPFGVHADYCALNDLALSQLGHLLSQVPLPVDGSRRGLCTSVRYHLTCSPQGPQAVPRLFGSCGPGSGYVIRVPLWSSSLHLSTRLPPTRGFASHVRRDPWRRALSTPRRATSGRLSVAPRTRTRRWPGSGPGRSSVPPARRHSAPA